MSTEARTGTRVCAIVPAYNAAPYIAAALQSASAQACAALEVIVVDDGSTDGTPDVARATAPDARLLLQSNQGVAAARNRAVIATEAPFIAFLDADDIWMPGKLARQLAVFDRYPDVGLVASGFERMNPDGTRIDHGPHVPLTLCDQPLDFSRVLLDGDNVLGMSTVVVRRELLVEAGGFYVERRVGSTDYDMWLRIADRTPFYICSDVLVRYRELPDSMLHGTTTKEFGAQLNILERHRDRFTDAQWRARMARLYYDWADSAIDQQEAEWTRRWWEAVRRAPFGGRTWLLGLRGLMRDSVLVRR